MPNAAPVIIVGRLAVDRAHARRGIGSGLLKDAMLRSLAASQSIGVRALLVHAIDDEAIAFYLRYGFVEFPDGTKTLFMPIEAIAAAIRK
jgi:GNAT superfamily N-acetyltransferase